MESAQSPLAAADGVRRQHLRAATRFDLREREERPAAEWRELRSAQGLAERAAEMGPPAPGLVSAPRAQVQYAAVAAVESGSLQERPGPVRCAAESELAPAPALLRPRAAVAAAPFSLVLFPAPFPFPAPAAWQVPRGASEQQAAPLPAVVGAELAAKASVPRVGEHVVVPRPAVVVAAKAVQREAEPLEAPAAPVALLSALPWAAAWAFRRGRLPPWPALRPKVRSVHAMEPPRTAGL